MSEIDQFTHDAISMAQKDIASTAGINGLVAGARQGPEAILPAATDAAVGLIKKPDFTCGTLRRAAFASPFLSPALHASEAIAGYDACLRKISSDQRAESAAKAAIEVSMPGVLAEDQPLAAAAAASTPNIIWPKPQPGASKKETEDEQPLPSYKDPAKNVGPLSCDQARSIALAVPYVNSIIHAKEAATGETAFCGDKLTQTQRTASAGLAFTTLAFPAAGVGDKALHEIMVDVAAPSASEVIDDISTRLAKRQAARPEPTPTLSPPIPSAPAAVEANPSAIAPTDFSSKLAERRARADNDMPVPAPSAPQFAPAR